MTPFPDDKSFFGLRSRIRAEIAYLDSPTDYRECIRRRETGPLVMLSEIKPARRQTPTETMSALLWMVLIPIIVYGVLRLVIYLCESL